MNTLKKIVIFILVLISLISLILFLNKPYKDEFILNGYYDSLEYWDNSSFQDYTDYCKYYYNSKDDNLFKNSGSYKKVRKEDINTLIGYFDNFSNWVKNRDYEYDLDNSYITEGDYFIIKTKNYIGKYDNYTVYFYDIETHILYYIHSNI